MGNIVKAQETKRHGWSWSGIKQLPRGLFLLERFSQISILVQSRGLHLRLIIYILRMQRIGVSPAVIPLPRSNFALLTET
jgi:hypothetical protein